MADPQDLILPLLREMRAEMKDGFERMDRKFAEQDVRFDRLESCFDNLRQAMYGRPALGRYVATEGEGRLDAIEKRLKVIASVDEGVPFAKRRSDLGIA